MAIGKLWWNADSREEAAQWQTEYLAKGALLVELKPEADRSVVSVLITLHKERAKEVFGYEPEEVEWLDVSELEAQAKALAFPSVEEMIQDQTWLEVEGLLRSTKHGLALQGVEDDLKGSVGKHDWCIGKECGDGFLVFVDDRPLSYRSTPLAAKEYAQEIIARLQADGDYRLNDRPAGFLPPRLTGN